jgi:hypothetical protein
MGAISKTKISGGFQARELLQSIINVILTDEAGIFRDVHLIAFPIRGHI